MTKSGPQCNNNNKNWSPRQSLISSFILLLCRPLISFFFWYTPVFPKEIKKKKKHFNVLFLTHLFPLFVNFSAAPSPSLSHHVFAVLCKTFKPFLNLTLILSWNLPCSSLPLDSFSFLFFFLPRSLVSWFSHSLFQFSHSYHPIDFPNLFLPPCRQSAAPFRAFD